MYFDQNSMYDSALLDKRVHPFSYPELGWVRREGSIVCVS